MTSAIVGSTEPRLFTPEARTLTEGTTDGYAFLDWWEAHLVGPEFGAPLPWQRWLAHHLLELSEDGTYRHRTVLVLIARQNGKTAFLTALALWRMHVKRHRVLGAAQQLSTALEALQRGMYLTEDSNVLDGATSKMLLSNGKESIQLANRATWSVAAANRRAGRGKTIDLLILDELREQTDYDAWSALSKTIMARPEAQIVAITNAGEDDSVVLNDLRAKALEGGDHAPALFEWSAEDGCDLDSPESWAAANPSLGHGFLTETAILGALATDPPAKFRTEVLCQKVDVLDSAIDMVGWNSCADPSGSLTGPLAACLDVAPDGAHATLIVAGRSGAQIRIATAGEWSDTETLRAELPALLEKIKPRVFGWFPGGPAAALMVDLQDIPRAQALSDAEVKAVCSGFAEQVASRKVLHSDDPMLSAQLAGAKRRSMGDGWRFTRSGGPVDAAYAAAGAVHLARQLPVHRTGFRLPSHLRENS